VKTRILQADGSYVRISKESGERMQAQEWLIENRGVWNRNLVKETVR
jgi:hypothetical protein